ncbi:MAG: thioredoxin domain-containing protein [Chloroflexi bacterium]|nr:thioredoxin domain-containing protein [Chloroflexota bacterium]
MSTWHRLARRAGWSIWLGLLILGLAGCRARGVPSSTPPPPPSQPVISQPTPTRALATPSQVPCQILAPPQRQEKGPLLPTDHFRGDANAAVWIIVYGDFQSPAYASMAQRLERLRAERPHELAWVFRAYPLAAVHDKALLAVQIAEAAAQQGAFWPMHDALVQRLEEWRELTPEAFLRWAMDVAQDLGLDPERLRRDATSDALVRLAQTAWERGRAAGLASVPILFLNGELYTGPQDEAALRSVIALEALSARMFRTCPPRLDPKQAPRMAYLETNRGRIALALLPEQNIDAVSSFVALTRAGWYDHTPVYRVVPGKAVYLGDPSGTGYGHAGFLFPVLPQPAIALDGPGWAALDLVSPGMADGRFFITLEAWPAEAASAYPRFGRVVQGIDLLRALPAWGPEQGTEPPLRVLRVHFAAEE